MLILTRRVQEKIIIGEDVEVLVLGVNGGQVKIGIAAPNDVKVLRSELINRHPTQLTKTKITNKRKRLSIK